MENLQPPWGRGEGGWCAVYCPWTLVYRYIAVLRKLTDTCRDTNTTNTIVSTLIFGDDDDTGGDDIMLRYYVKLRAYLRADQHFGGHLKPRHHCPLPRLPRSCLHQRLQICAVARAFIGVQVRKGVAWRGLHQRL